MSNPDRIIERTARKQFGAFSRTQATDAGVTKRMMQVRVRAEAWARRSQDVFVITAVPANSLQHLMCATLNHSGSAVCGRPAARVHGMLGSRPSRAELVVPSTGAHRSPLAILHRSDDVETMMVGPLPVVTPTQVIFDLAGTVPLRKLRRMTEDAVLRGLIDPDHLRARFEHLAPAFNRGIGDVRSVVDSVCRTGWIPPTTELEALLDDLLTELGVHATRQKTFDWRAPVPMVVDSFVEDHRFIAEADGRLWHARVEAMTSDRRRDLAALAHGYETARFTYEMLTVERAQTRRVLKVYLAHRRVALDALAAHGFDLSA